MVLPSSLSALSQLAAVQRGTPVRQVAATTEPTTARPKSVSPLPATPDGAASARPAPRGTLLNISV